VKLIAVSVYGLDKPGIIYGISKVLADNNVNIVDIEQNVLQGLFVMFIIGDVEKCAVPIEDLKRQLEEKGKELGVHVHLTPFVKPKQKEKNLYVITVLGKDRVGIVRDITKILLEHNVNIERTALTARDKLISIEFIVDIGDANPDEIKKQLKKEVESCGLDIVIQPYSIFKREKRLIVFDMDSTIVDAEIIDELAKAAGVEKEVKEITKKAMEGKLDYKQALIERVKLLSRIKV